MNNALWIVQGALALIFLMAGGIKLIQPKEKLVEKMAWANDFSPGVIKLIGAVEVLGAIGLILPQMTGILPWLTPLAALGLALTMVVAMVVHLRRNEAKEIIINLVLLLLALFVAYGRFV